MNAQAAHLEAEIAMLANRVIRDTARAIEADERGLDRVADTHRGFCAVDARMAFAFAGVRASIVSAP